MANIGFATISVIPSFKGLNVRARAGLAVLTKIGEDAGEDSGKAFSKKFERNAEPDMRKAGKQAASTFADAGAEAGRGFTKEAESTRAPDFRAIGSDAGRSFTRGAEAVSAPDFTSQGRRAGQDFSRAAESAASPDLTPQGEGAGDSFGGGILASLKSGAKGGLAAAGIVAAAILSKAFLNGLDREVTTDRLVAQLGPDEPNVKAAGKAAGELYLQGFGDNRSEAAAAVRGVLQFGLLGDIGGADQGETAEFLERTAGAALTLSDVLEQDLTGVLTAASTLIKNGLARNATEAFDLLTKGIQEGADKGLDLLDTFIEYPTSFRELGLSGQDAMGLIVQGLEAGARNSDFLADALKEFGIRGQDASELSAEGFRILGIDAAKATKAIATGGKPAREVLAEVLDSLRDMTDPVKRNAAAVALFGTKAEDLGDALFALDLDDATAKLGNHLGSTEELGSAYDNASSKVEAFKRQALEKVTVFLAEEVIPWLEKTWPKVERVGETFLSWVDIVRGVVEDTIGLLQDIVDFVTALPGNLAEVGHDIWGWLSRGFETVANGILSGFETMINAVIDGINLAIQAANDANLFLNFLDVDKVDPVDLPRLGERNPRDTFGGKGNPFFHASGGPVFGPEGVDRVPAWLTAGEFVVKKKMVDKYGLGLMHALNAGRFAGGGLVNVGGKLIDPIDEAYMIPGLLAAAQAGGGLINVGGKLIDPIDEAYMVPGLLGNASAPAPWSDWSHAGSIGSVPGSGGDINIYVTQYPGEDQVTAGLRALRWHHTLRTELAVR